MKDQLKLVLLLMFPLFGGTIITLIVWHYFGTSINAVAETVENWGERNINTVIPIAIAFIVVWIGAILYLYRSPTKSSTKRYERLNKRIEVEERVRRRQERRNRSAQ